MNTTIRDEIDDVLINFNFINVNGESEIIAEHERRDLLNLICTIVEEIMKDILNKQLT